MSAIELPKEAREALAQALSRYLKDELDVEVGGFDALFLLDFIIERIGPSIYNQGLYDAQALISKKVEAAVEDILALEKPVKPGR